jgi:hypothetical protein
VLALAAPVQAQVNFGNLFGGNAGGRTQSRSRTSPQNSIRNPEFQGDSSSEFQWQPLVGGIIEGISKIPLQPPPQNNPYPPGPVRPYYPPPNYHPQPQYVPPRVPQNAVSRPPARTPAPRNALVRKVNPPTNNPALGLTDLQDQATENTADEADKIAEQAEALVLNDPNLDQALKAEVEAAINNGDTAALEKIIKDNPNMHPSVQQKIGIFVDATNAGKLIRTGGVNPKGTDILIANLKGKIENATLPQPHKKSLLDQVESLQESNDNRKIIDALIASGGSGGGPGGGGIILTGIDLTSLDPQGPIFVADPVQDADGAAVSSGTLLLNPAVNGETISYVLANRQYTMKPGQSQRLDRTYTIEFHRGGEFGNARYSLPTGTYEFTITDRGWELKKKTYEATIDNSRYPGPFGYVLDNKQYTVTAGEQRTHTGAYPLLVIFDQGDGGEPARKELRSGTYYVGLDAHEGRLDLFSEDEERLLSKAD